MEKEDRLYKLIRYDQASYENHAHRYGFKHVTNRNWIWALSPQKYFPIYKLALKWKSVDWCVSILTHYTLTSPVISVSCPLCLLWLVVVIYVMTTIIASITILVAYTCIGIPYHTINLLLPPMITSHCYRCTIYEVAVHVSNEVRI